MDRFSLTHLTDGALLSGLKTNVARERDALADVLAHIAEVDERKLYVPAGYGSMQDYCVHELHFSRDAANKRIRAARAAEEFPAIYEKVAEGALRLTSLSILASYLRPETAEGLLTAASFKSDFEVKEILAEWYPRAPIATTIEPVAEQRALDSEPAQEHEAELVAAQPLQGVAKPRVAPLAADLYKLQLTMTGAMYAKLRRAVELFGRRKPVPDEAEILELGLDLLVRSLEKQKFAATDRPRAPRYRPSVGHVPADVQRTVWERDGGRCTFTSEDGTRCPARMDLEWDHIVPVAKGGGSEASNVRLRCRAHNQYEAERAFGKAFMEHKREQARAAAAKRSAEKAARKALDDDEVIPWLRKLGVTMAEARFALSECGSMAELTIETRLKRCLAVLAPPHRKVAPALQ